MVRMSNGAAYPPQSISIRGSGGPYVVVVGNVAKGTTTEDIELTFEPFGPLEGVSERPPPSVNYPSLSFEVVFVRRDDANAACASLNGCLADGRVLSVAPRSSDVASGHNSFSGQASAAARERLNAQGRLDAGPAPHPRSLDATAHHAPAPTAPAKKSKKQAAPPVSTVPQAQAQKHAQTQTQTQTQTQAQTQTQTQNKAQPQADPPKSLSKRLGLGPSPAEKKAQALAKAAKAAKQGKISTTPSLRSRIAIPLSERLGASGQGVDPKKRAALPSTKGAKGKAAQKTGPGASKAAQKRTAKRAQGDGDRMDMD